MTVLLFPLNNSTWIKYRKIADTTAKIEDNEGCLPIESYVGVAKLV